MSGRTSASEIMMERRETRYTQPVELGSAEHDCVQESEGSQSNKLTLKLDPERYVVGKKLRSYISLLTEHINFIHLSNKMREYLLFSYLIRYRTH